MPDSDCLFCRIASGDVPADVVYTGERLVAFRDISPQAPVHLLIIPKDHIPSLGAAEAHHGDLLGELVLLARELAQSEGVAEGGFRTILNTGRDGGQTVDHLHLHVLGGRALGWPPG